MIGTACRVVVVLDARVAVVSLFVTRAVSTGSASRAVLQVSRTPCHLNKSSRCSSSAISVYLPMIWNTSDTLKNTSAFDKPLYAYVGRILI